MASWTRCVAVVTLGSLLPSASWAQAAPSNRAQVQQVQVERGAAAPEAGTKTIHSSCAPSFCGYDGYHVYAYFNVPGCATLDCGTETWSVEGLSPTVATYTIDPPETTGSNKTKITLTFAADAEWGTSAPITVAAHCSPATCTPLTVNVQVNASEPENFRQVSGVGGAEPGGLLQFYYVWDSSTGDVADLVNCYVGSSIAYPDGNPYVWPKPPWNGESRNPEVSFVAATLGKMEEIDGSKPFVKPYKEKSFAASENFFYLCKSPPAPPSLGPQFFPDQVHIEIDRVVHDVTGRGCWVYAISQYGDTNEALLPGVAATACASAPTPPKPTPMTASKPDGARTDDGSRVAMSVSPVRAAIGLNEPIFADLKILNRSAKVVPLDLGLDGKSNIELRIQDPAGEVSTRNVRSTGVGGSGEVSLDPNGAVAERLLLNEWYEFPSTGTYSINVTLLDRATGAARTSTEFALQVGPRYPERLRRISQELADTAISGATLEQSMEAANALSYIVDPLAVDSLVRVLQHAPLVASSAVQGLGRIGGATAIAAVAAAQNHPDEDVRTTAQYVLRALQEGNSVIPSRAAD